MKLWEALEKSNKVRRKGWNAEIRPFDITKREAISINEFQADDWEPYEEPKPATELEQLKMLIEPLKNHNDDICNPWDEVWSLVVYIMEQQAQKIDQLESEQQKWKHMSAVKVDSGIAISGTGGSGYGTGGNGGIYKSTEQMRCKGEDGVI